MPAVPHPSAMALSNIDVRPGFLKEQQQQQQQQYQHHPQQQHSHFFQQAPSLPHHSHPILHSDQYSGQDSYPSSGSSSPRSSPHSSPSPSTETRSDPHYASSTLSAPSQEEGEGAAVELNESGTSKPSKGKLFQCSGFGDCRMVFTRSEHLARHARKHTGEKPFKCVVEGCTRMFSRFDNMVQHTQTHTKGPHRESSEGIASKIAIESRRKSEAGLVLSQGPVRTSSKVSKPKRGSISSTSGSEALPKARHNRRSMPVLTVSTEVPSLRRPRREGSSSSTTPVPPSPATASSTSPSPPFYMGEVLHQHSHLVHPVEVVHGPIFHDRRGSLVAPVGHPSCDTLYASKLHHRSSLDSGLNQYSRYAAMNRQGYESVSHNLDEHLPPVYQDAFVGRSDQPVRFPARHPLSPERSGRREDCMMEALPWAQTNVAPGFQQHSWTAAPASMDHCTLPPLRQSDAPPAFQARLPSIAQGRYRSQSTSSGYEQDPELFVNKSRRLSLVDLNMPIQETRKAVHHSMDAHQAKLDGVDVSEDEIQALEAFGDLWSQGRDIQMGRERHPTSGGQSSPTGVVQGQEIFAPGLDYGRRVLYPQMHSQQQQQQQQYLPYGSQQASYGAKPMELD